MLSSALFTVCGGEGTLSKCVCGGKRGAVTGKELRYLPLQHYKHQSQTRIFFQISSGTERLTCCQILIMDRAVFSC